MAYFRSNGRISGRLGGRGTGLSIDASYSLGDISEAGLGPQIVGDPTVALLAQLNRFAGKTLSPGNGGDARKYVAAPFALASGNLDLRAATSAVMILIDRYQYADVFDVSRARAGWAIGGLDNPVQFVTANLAVVTQTISQFGDKLGLAPATVGITTRDPKFTPKFPVATVAAVGILGVVAFAISRRK